MISFGCGYHGKCEKKKKHDNYINKYNTNNFKGINNNKHDNCRASKCVYAWSIYNIFN